MQSRSPVPDGLDSSAVRRFRPSNMTEKPRHRGGLFGRGKAMFRSASVASRRLVVAVVVAAVFAAVWVASVSRGINRIGSVSGDAFFESLRADAGTKSDTGELCANPQKLGDDYGGWTICNADNVQGGLVYTIGIGRNIEWDKAMISRFHTVHHGWDPTPSAKGFFEDKAPPPGFHFHQYGLGVADGNVTVKLPVGNKDSYTIMKYGAQAQDGTIVSIPVLTIKSMLTMLGHERIAILKIDCEGVEFATIAEWARTGYRPPAKQILIEFHERYFTSDTAPGGVSPRMLVPTAIEQMKGLGFEMLHKHHWEYTFVQRDSTIGQN